MKTTGIVKAMVTTSLVTMMAVTACAKGNMGGGKQQGPPPEAIKACEGKQEGDSVSFKGRRGESLSATCQTIDGQLAAVPEGHKPRQ